MEVIDCLGFLWIGVLNVVLSSLDNRIPLTHRWWERLCQEVRQYCHNSHLLRLCTAVICKSITDCCYIHLWAN